MRAVTATEKYRAVNEGSLSKKEFVRQMRQQYPMYISQFNGYNDTVQILKNKAMLFEASKPAFAEAKVYDDRPALTYSLDALDRGIRIELGVLKLDPASASISREALDTATSKAKTNLEKDCNHYLNLMSGESNKVDKHDRDVEVKRGDKATDVFNGLKKATLKEEIEGNQDGDDEELSPEELANKHAGSPMKGRMKEDEEEDAKNDADYEAGWHDDPRKDETMTEDAKKQLLGKVVGALRTKYPDITGGVLKNFILTHGQDLLNGADIEDEFGEYISVNYEGPSDMSEAEEGIDMSSKDGYISFIDNENILTNYTPEDAEEMARELAMTHHDAGQDQDNFVRSFMAAYKEGGHDTHDQVHEKQGKDHDGDGDIDGDDYMASKDKAIKKAMGKDEGYAMKRMQQAHQQASQAGEKSAYDKKDKEKEDKDKQIKEAIKSIIRKTLNEDNLNEAATVKLADWAESYESFPGVKPVVNELENIVTEIESFYDRMSDKIGKVFEKTGAFENEEGLKIGGFIAPSLEAAFGRDLSKVIKKVSFYGKINLPKVRTITQADIDSNATGETPLGETENTSMRPKSTLYTPNF